VLASHRFIRYRPLCGFQLNRSFPRFSGVRYSANQLRHIQFRFSWKDSEQLSRYLNIYSHGNADVTFRLRQATDYPTTLAQAERMSVVETAHALAPVYEHSMSEIQN